MTVTARKYNPGFLSDDELVASFCVRTGEFASMVEVLRECTGKANTHHIVIGPRGSGKTSLLLRIAAEIRRDADLSSRFFPIVFAEESYEVSTAGEFWLECLSRLADQAPRREDGPDLHRTFEELRQIQDDRTLGDRCLGVLQDFSDRERKRLVLLVENLNMMFRDIADDDAGWRLRQTLQNDPRFLLLASATSRFDEIDKPDRAFYDLFRVLTLRPLDTDGCATLWQTVSGRHGPEKTIRALQILTGGSPRLLTIVARFGGKLSFRELMVDLLDLVDDHTEYFKSHLDALPQQERRVYLALADFWKPATAREIADRARLDTSKCSAQLARLTEKGAVVVTAGSPRRKHYYLAERLYNIYYLMRRARGLDPLIGALIRFMESYYSPAELKEFGARMVREAPGFDAPTWLDHLKALARLVELPSMRVHREELLSLVSMTEDLHLNRMFELTDRGNFVEAKDAWNRFVGLSGRYDASAVLEDMLAALFNKHTIVEGSHQPEELLTFWADLVQRLENYSAPLCLDAVAQALEKKAVVLAQLDRPKEALVVWDEIVRRFGVSNRPTQRNAVVRALVRKAFLLEELSQPEEVLAIWDEVVRRSSTSDAPESQEAVARALHIKGNVLAGRERWEEALGIWGEVVQRFATSEVPEILHQIVSAIVHKGFLLTRLNRPEEALAAWDDIVERFGTSDVPDILRHVATALVSKGNVLGDMDKLEEALKAWDELMQSFGKSDQPGILEKVGVALLNRGVVLNKLHRQEEAFAAWDEVVRRFGTSDTTDLLETVSNSLIQKGFVLYDLNRPEEALAAWDEVVRRFGTSDVPDVLRHVATALVSKGNMLGDMDKLEEALKAWDELVQSFGKSDQPEILEKVGVALLNRGVVLNKLRRQEEAFAAWDEVVRRFGTSDATDQLEAVSNSLIQKGTVLYELNQPEEALAAWDEVVRRFGTSDATNLLESVSNALVQKGIVLYELNRRDEALAVCGDVVRRFATSDTEEFLLAVAAALLLRAEIERECGQFEAAIETVNQVLQERGGVSREVQWRGHLIRARANLEDGNDTACARDVEFVLNLLPEFIPLPKEALDFLSELAVDFGPAQMRDLIRQSPAAALLLPLTTALERELGMEPRVAREIEEVAEDIRRDMENRRMQKGIRQSPLG